MTEKEKLPPEVLDLDESEESELPAGWGETLTSEPMPDVAAALRCSRESH